MTHAISSIIDLTNAPTPPRWFEFLLEPKRLQQHLETNGCDPSPTQLISLFFRNIPNIESNTSQSPSQKNPTINSVTTNGNALPISSSSSIGTTPSSAAQQGNQVTEEGVNRSNINDSLPEKLLIDYSDSAEVLIPPDSYEAKYRTKKAYALQTLAIKVASFLKWDLDVICNDLTIPVQYKLMQALNTACSSDSCPQEVKKFSTILYNHWFLRSAITYQLSTLQPQSNNTTIIYLSQLQQQQQAADSSALYSMGELFAPTSKHLKTCSNELRGYVWDLTHNKDNSPKKLKGSTHPFKKAKLSRPTMDCFDSRNEQYNNWDKCEPIESKKFLEAACYDLGRFFFFEESYELSKQAFEIIKEFNGKFPKLAEYLKSSTDILSGEQNGKALDDKLDCDLSYQKEVRRKTEKYLFDCMEEFSKSQLEESKMEVESDEYRFEHDSDLRPKSLNNWYIKIPKQVEQQQLLEAAKGDVFMAQGNFKQAMGCFVGTLMLMTDYFRFFSKSYVEEEPYISRMIQCSISLSCFTQAVALCQMTRSLNYTIAFKQLNERICNDCCDDIYECIWNVTLLEYIINLHSKRGEVERRTRVIQLLGQLELNENNPEEILREAEHVRRGRFFRIMSNKYL